MSADPVRPTLEQMLPLADAVLERVRSWVDGEGASGVSTRDRTDVVLVAAFGRAYRCMVSIRETASREEADDTQILVRSLLSIALRSLYVVSPDKAEQRDERLRRWVRTWRSGNLKMIRELKALGYDVTDEALADAEALAAEYEDVAAMPHDVDLATALKLEQHYSHVYRSTSDAVHFGIGTLLEGFLTQPTSALGEGASVALEMPDPQRAADALMYGIVVYGTFLEMTEPIMGHGLTAGLVELINQTLESADASTE